VRRALIPIAVGALLVPAAITAFGFSVYGDELAEGLPSSAATGTITAPALSVPGLPVDWAALEELPPRAAVPSAEMLQRDVSGVFAEHAVKGITFAPGTADLVGRGDAVQRAVGGALRPATTAVITLVAHAWNGETASHRCDLLALERAGLVRQYLLSQGVPAGAINTRVIVDPVWGTDAGPQVDVVVR
jgi:hypothetical protein